jgi:hypothetical protein
MDVIYRAWCYGYTVDEWMDGWIDCSIDWIEGRMDGWMNK